MPLSTIFQLNIAAVSFIDGGNQSTQRKPTDMPQVTESNYIT
jgi:hypothetical protein